MSKVAILTNFQEFQPGYSLTGIVKDQARMLKLHGHDVDLYVSDQYHGEDFGPDVTLKKCIPFSHLIDYDSMADLTADHKELIAKTAAMLIRELADTPYVFTHDFVFTGWNIPYGLACAEASKYLPQVRWFHWVHSIPSVGPMGSKDFWNINFYGQNHKLIYPNRTDSVRVAEAFRGDLDCVRVIPHIKDLRTWADFDDETCKFIADYPQVMQAETVQIYPASVDRLTAKRVREVILIFSKMKKMGASVCLVIANQWATEKQHKEDVMHYKKIGARNGMEPGVDLIFTSDWQEGKYAVGLPKRILRELFMLSNLFIFPTREETFGLVLPEAALAGGVYCVLNKSLAMQAEVSGFQALYFDFGAFNHTHNVDNEEKYFTDIAWLVLGRMKQNEAICTKTFMRVKYNWDSLYNKYYRPIMGEAEVW